VLARLIHSTALPIVFDRWWHKGRPAIGLDFGTYSLKALQLGQGHGEWSVRAAAERRLSAE